MQVLDVWVDDCEFSYSGSFLPNLYFDSKIIINSRPLGCTCSWRCNGLELCTHQISCFFAFSRFSFPGNPSNIHIVNVFLV